MPAQSHDLAAPGRLNWRLFLISHVAPPDLAAVAAISVPNGFRDPHSPKAGAARLEVLVTYHIAHPNTMNVALTRAGCLSGVVKADATMSAGNAAHPFLYMPYRSLYAVTTLYGRV